jgi:hypothetical protein
VWLTEKWLSLASLAAGWAILLMCPHMAPLSTALHPSYPYLPGSAPKHSVLSSLLCTSVWPGSQLSTL